jgi:release factor glutamine methyltransferase
MEPPVVDATLDVPVRVDWTSSLDGTFGDSFLRDVRALDISTLQRFPPPKMGGLPFGHEIRILRRFARGASSMLDQSAFSELYRAFATPRQRLAYRALVIGEELSRGEWEHLIGAEAASAWTHHHMLSPAAAGGLRARFRAVVASGLVLIVDPLDEAFRFRVHIGQDSLNMAEFLEQRHFPPDARALDVGTGSGVLLMTIARGRREGVGVDINPRAVRLARFNARLNELRNCRIEERDVFAASDAIGRFDIVTWNTPFMFFPESWKETSVDGYGGHLGIEIPLRFIDLLPSLLADRGVAFVLAAAPRMLDGTNRLDAELRSRLPSLGLDATAHVLQTFWVPQLREFYDQHGVRNFESVILELSVGRGRLIRRQRASITAATDALRDLVYRVRS